MNEVVYVTSEADWESLYINGKLVSSGHSIDVDDALSLVAELRGPITYEKKFDEDGNYIDEHGEFPELLEDLDI